MIDSEKKNIISIRTQINNSDKSQLTKVHKNKIKNYWFTCFWSFNPLSNDPFDNDLF